jgi:predicted metal-binding membrane protein
VLAALAALTALAWLALLPIGRGMMSAGMAGMAMAPPVVTVGDLALGFAMWAVMMPGMMLPSAAPMILTVARVHRARRARFGVTLPLAAFLAGYLLVWTGFSAVAAVAQWGLARAGAIAGMDGRAGPVLGGALFVLAGIYQLSPLKHACLGSCRSPLGFLLAHWRDGTGGALRMGVRHGAVCLGCCWALMVLLFAVGTMNLVWVAGLGVLVLVEKLAPGGGWVARVSGVGMVVAGVAVAGLG